MSEKPVSKTVPPCGHKNHEKVILCGDCLKSLQDRHNKLVAVTEPIAQAMMELHAEGLSYLKCLQLIQENLTDYDLVEAETLLDDLKAEVDGVLFGHQDKIISKPKE